MRILTRLRPFLWESFHAQHSIRSLSTASYFDRQVKQIQRETAACAPNAEKYDYFRNEVARRLVDRVCDIKHDFPMVADIGCGKGHFLDQLIAVGNPPPKNIAHVVQVDSSEKILRLNHQKQREQTDITYSYAVGDEGELPLAPATYDLITSNLSMHWVNDLPSLLKQVYTALKPDGCFLAAMIGGESLQELRSSIVLAEMERLGGVGSHLSPLTRVKDCGDLMQAAGFSLLTVDQQSVNVRFPDMFTLVEHLQGMGENHAPIVPPTISRDVLLSAASIYQSLYADKEGMLNCTVNIVWLIGWRPHHTQQKPKSRGSATFNLANVQKDLGSLPEDDQGPPPPK